MHISQKETCACTFYVFVNEKGTCTCTCIYTGAILLTQAHRQRVIVVGLCVCVFQPNLCNYEIL